jgi:steroid 5-alpha reductase family enzyme
MEYLIHSFLITALVVLWSLFLVWKYNHPLAQVSGFVLMYWPVDMSLNRSDAQQITQLVMSYEQKKISSLFVFTTVIIQYGTPNNAYQTGQSITLILTAVLTFIILKEFDKSTFSEDLREKLSEYEPNFDDLKDAVKEKVEEKIKFI